MGVDFRGEAGSVKYAVRTFWDLAALDGGGSGLPKRTKELPTAQLPATCIWRRSARTAQSVQSGSVRQIALVPTRDPARVPRCANPAAWSVRRRCTSQSPARMEVGMERHVWVHRSAQAAIDLPACVLSFSMNWTMPGRFTGTLSRMIRASSSAKSALSCSVMSLQKLKGLTSMTK